MADKRDSNGGTDSTNGEKQRRILLQAYLDEYNETLRRLLELPQRAGGDGQERQQRVQPPPPPQQQQQSSSTSSSKSLLRECRDLLRRMSLEARQLEDDDLRFEWRERVKVFRNQLSQIETREVEEEEQRQQQKVRDGAARSESNQRDELFGRNDGGGGSQRRQLTENGEGMLARQNATLERARRVMAETEETAMEVCEQLSEQRATIESSHANARELGTLTARAGELMTSITKPWWRPR